jgi:opacity protein-like surface antigen
MNKHTRFLLICLAACGMVAPLWAQDSPAKDWPYRVEVFGAFGNGRLYNGDSRWGSGLDYGGGIGVRPFSGWMKRIGFEFEGSHLSKSRTSTSTAVIQNQTFNTAIFQNLDSRLLQGSVLYHFRSGARVQPFASVGIAHTKADYSYRCESCVFDVEPGTGRLIPIQSDAEKYNGSKIGITIGGGLKVAIHRHLSIRSQVQLADTTAGSGINLSWLRLQIGLGVHF